LRLVAVPAAIALLVTAGRLVGELRGWSPRWFGTDAGSPGALFGIGWLIPVFGAWFGWRLAAQRTIPSRTRAILLPAAGTVLAFATLALASAAMPRTIATFVFIATSLPVYATLSWFAWPELARVNLLFALACRLPIVALTIVAVPQAWGTHYEKMAPGSPELSLAGRTAVLCAAQFGLWVPITMLAGGLAGGVAASLWRRS
jgi:hypothetical protein